MFNHLSRIKNIFFVNIFFALISFIANGQQKVTPQLLKEPANWQFERFALPPEFAPNFPYKGAEELRFSPGMFNKDSAEYFTYAFAAELDNTTSISRADIRNYLLIYFKGLCSNTAGDRKLIIDTSKITVAIEKKNSAVNNENIYNAVLNVFGVFADGAPVKLNMEIKVLTDVPNTRIYLVFIASPHNKDDTAWKMLYKIQKFFLVPGNKTK